MGNKKKYIISGGGTGGHVYPAIAIADEIKKRNPESEILFVGAKGKIEMTKVPLAGYNIIGLSIMGLDRRKIWRNIGILYKFFLSLRKSKKIIKEFKPDVVIGVGGYASAPVLRMANKMKLPTVLQEQNSYAGVTNKMLAKDATAICVAYDDMSKYFPAEKIIKTGNPYRESLLNVKESKEDALHFFGLDPHKKTLLVLGGSLGARTINAAISSYIASLIQNDIQVIWQCGKSYIFDLQLTLGQYTSKEQKMIVLSDFIDRMDLAYKAADLVVSRAGASSISELSLLAKPCILVPSPNVAEDHQTKNASALGNKEAAIVLGDEEAKYKLVDTSIEIIQDQNRLETLSNNIKEFAIKDSAKKIVDVIENLK